MTNTFVENNNPQIIWASGAWHISLVQFIGGSADGKIGLGMYKNNISINSVWIRLEEKEIYTVSQAQRYFLANSSTLGATLFNVAQNLIDQKSVSLEIVGVYIIAANNFSPLKIVE